MQFLNWMDEKIHNLCKDHWVLVDIWHTTAATVLRQDWKMGTSPHAYGFLWVSAHLRRLLASLHFMESLGSLFYVFFPV